MEARSKILVVDDEPFNLEIMQEILEPEFDVSYAKSGEECLELVENIQPSIILLDINMPGISGYETCKQLKEGAATHSIPITFVSALDTLAERLAGYEVGGDDYITKPFEPKELINKIRVALKAAALRDDLKSNADMAMSTAMTAMTSTSELGVVLQFLRASFGCNEISTLAGLVVDSMMQYGLRSTVQFRVNDEEINKCSDGVVNTLEATVLQRICNEDRIIDMGNRTIINYEHVSLLIKSMPMDDIEKYGRIKDNVALLVEGAEARVLGIVAQQDLERKQSGLVKLVNTTRDTLSGVERKHEANKIESMRILGELIRCVEESFSFLGLSETQEEAMLKMVNSAVGDTIGLYNDGLEIDHRLAEVMTDLQSEMDVKKAG